MAKANLRSSESEHVYRYKVNKQRVVAAVRKVVRDVRMGNCFGAFMGLLDAERNMGHAHEAAMGLDKLGPHSRIVEGRAAIVPRKLADAAEVFFFDRCVQRYGKPGASSSPSTKAQRAAIKAAARRG